MFEDGSNFREWVCRFLPNKKHIKQKFNHLNSSSPSGTGSCFKMTTVSCKTFSSSTHVWAPSCRCSDENGWCFESHGKNWLGFADGARKDTKVICGSPRYPGQRSNPIKQYSKSVWNIAHLWYSWPWWQICLASFATTIVNPSLVTEQCPPTER